MAATWREGAVLWEQDHSDYRVALGKHLEFSLRLAFAEAWHERAVKHGDTFRFNVVDQPLNNGGKIFELTWHARAPPPPQPPTPPIVPPRDRPFKPAWSLHPEHLIQLLEPEEAK